MYYHIVSILSSIIIYYNMYSEFTSGSNLIKAVAAHRLLPQGFTAVASATLILLAFAGFLNEAKSKGMVGWGDYRHWILY